MFTIGSDSEPAFTTCAAMLCWRSLPNQKCKLIADRPIYITDGAYQREQNIVTCLSSVRQLL